MLESLTFFGISMEYFGVFQKLLINSRSFHFGVMLEFSGQCDFHRFLGKSPRGRASSTTFSKDSSSAPSEKIWGQVRHLVPSLVIVEPTGCATRFQACRNRPDNFHPSSR